MRITIWSIFIVSVMALIIFGGIGSIIEYKLQKGELDYESTVYFLAYQQQFENLNDSYVAFQGEVTLNDTNLLETEPDVNTLDAFIKEYGEAKQRVGVLRNSLNMIDKVPSMLFLSLPFLELEDINFYKEILYYIIIVALGISIIVALFQRVVN